MVYAELKSKFVSYCETMEKKGLSIEEMMNYSSDSSTIPQDEKGKIFTLLIGGKSCEFLEFLKLYKKYNDRMIVAKEVDARKTITTEQRVTTRSISDSRSTAWGHYKAKLIEKNFGNVVEIESSSRNVIEMFKDETPQYKPNKGAIIGNVQSGKTANMEALISMASDNGWNVFIILSGTIDSLREQTEKRMLEELRPNLEDADDRSYNMDWINISPKMTYSKFINAVGAPDLSEGSNKRYISICLKNVIHLNNIISILSQCGNSGNMKILVIDDEADLASVNSKKNTRTRINQLLINLIYGMNKNGETLPHKFKSVNYLCYTATPYAILLNESDKVGRTLYPGDFIFALTPSNMYIGADRIFSREDAALSNKMVIIDDDISKDVGGLYSRPELMPESMKDAIAWFVCCVAIQRFRKYNKPVSMMMNIDFKHNEHNAVDSAVKYYLTCCKDDLRIRCRRIYDEFTVDFTVSDFKSMVPDYGKSYSEDEYPVIEDYAAYSDIEPLINSLIDADSTRIEFGPERNNDTKEYKSQIYVCVDNCAEGTEAINGEEFFTGRLSYPSKNDKIFEKTPAFIIIGGNTLSRGLTIEGLVVSYFRRVVKQADTLLQMGRWFGFRKGYELLPRIWMDGKSKSAFEELNIINEALVSKIEEYSADVMSPNEYPVQIRNVPEANMLKSLTARGKMRGARRIGVSFGGGPDKSISKYYDDYDKLMKNLNLTERLLSGIPDDKIQFHGGRGYLFKQIDSSIVLDYLKAFERPADKNISSGDACIQWLCKLDSEIKSFNIYLAGNSKAVDTMENPVWNFGNKHIYKMTRSAEKWDNGIIQIKTVRDKRDLNVDISESVWTKNSADINEKINNGNVCARNEARNKSDWSRTPLIVIGIVNSNQKYPADVVTLTVLIPSDIKSTKNMEGNYVYLDDTLEG